MTHELTFSELGLIVLVEESQYLLKLQSGKITKKCPLVTANCLVVLCKCHTISSTF